MTKREHMEEERGRQQGVWAFVLVLSLSNPFQYLGCEVNSWTNTLI